MSPSETPTTTGALADRVNSSIDLVAANILGAHRGNAKTTRSA